MNMYLVAKLRHSLEPDVLSQRGLFHRDRDTVGHVLLALALVRVHLGLGRLQGVLKIPLFNFFVLYIYVSYTYLNN